MPALEAYRLASRLLDRWLERIGPDSKAQLHSFAAGKSIRIHSRAGAFDCLLKIDDQRISIHPFEADAGSASAVGAADLDVEFSLAILGAPALNLTPHQWRERGWLVINGDLNFAEKLLEVSGDMPAGVGDVAQAFVGKTGAVIVDRLLNFVRNIFGQAVDNLRADAVDYLQYQGEILTDPATVAELKAQAEQLLRDLEALDERLSRLEK